MSKSCKQIVGVGAVAFFVFAALHAHDVFAQQAAATGVQVNEEAFKKEIERLQNEKAYEQKRVEEMRQEREQFVKEIRRVENLNVKYTKELEDMKAQMASQEQSFEARMKKMEEQYAEMNSPKPKSTASAEDASAKAKSKPVDNVTLEKKANEVLMKGGDLDPEDEKFKEELARAHYNMGNVYFERGEYQRAAVEYYQSVDLMPYDADAHYNLAFVSGEYVGDQETALKHYQWYLYLKPDCEDRKTIEEKILAAKISLRSRLADSKIEDTELSGHINMAR